MARSKSSTNRTIKPSTTSGAKHPHTAASGRTTKVPASKKSKRPKAAQAIYGANANS